MRSLADDDRAIVQCAAVVEDAVDEEAVDLRVDLDGALDESVERDLALERDERALALLRHRDDGLRDFGHDLTGDVPSSRRPSSGFSPRCTMPRRSSGWNRIARMTTT